MSVTPGKTREFLLLEIGRLNRDDVIAASQASEATFAAFLIALAIVRLGRHVDDVREAIAGVATHARGGRVTYGLAVGSADLIGIVGGRFAALEIKTPQGRMTPSQRRWAALVAAHGGRWACVRSVDEAVATVREWIVGVVD